MLLARARRLVAVPVTVGRQKLATRRCRSDLAALPRAVDPVTGWANDVVVLVSHRIVNDDRLAMLRVVADRVRSELAGTGVLIRVADASDGPWHDAASAAWTETGLDVTVEQRRESLPTALLRMLRDRDRPRACIQFDDMFTAGMRTFLEGGSTLLARGPVEVAAPMWACATTFEPERRTIVVRPTIDGRAGSRRFWNGRQRRALATTSIGQARWGVFENPTYGFFVNHLLAPTDDLAERFAWFVDRISNTSAHQIELAAARGRGPAWRHVAIPIEGAALVDVDFAHTDQAVRGELPDNRAMLDALAAGWALDAGSPRG